MNTSFRKFSNKLPLPIEQIDSVTPVKRSSNNLKQPKIDFTKTVFEEEKELLIVPSVSELKVVNQGCSDVSVQHFDIFSTYVN